MTYQEMCQFETLYRAYLSARKGKRKKAGTAQYEANALACTEKLSRVLLAKTYRPSKFEVFKVYRAEGAGRASARVCGQGGAARRCR